MKMNKTNRRIVLKVTGLLAAGMMMQLSSMAQTPGTKPNVLFIAIDDLNDWVGFLGGHPQAKTPHMDTLASRGVSFSCAQTPSPACSPCRNALLLGQHPFTTGLYPFYDYKKLYNSPPFSNAVTLPAHFKNNGYNTYGCGKIHHSSDGKAPPATLDEWTENRFVRKLPALVYAPEKGYQPAGKDPRKFAFCPTTNPLAEHRDYDTAQYGAGILQRQHDKPFFLALGFNKPHLPFVCPQQYFDLYADPIVPPPIKDDDLVDIPWAARSNLRLNHELAFRKDGAWEQVRRAYLACVSWTDANVGLVLDALAASPYAASTVVVLWSDHGYHLGEKRTFTKFTLWEEADRVPFIIYDPRVKPASHVCRDPVSLIDIFPTLCDLAGIPDKEGLDGESLVPWLRDPTRPKHTPAIVTWGRGNYSVRARDWRYNRYFDGSEELYAHANDPLERVNLADNSEFAGQKKRLARFLPESETPLVREAISLHNVVDADQPSLEKFKKNWDRVNRQVQPPFDD